METITFDGLIKAAVLILAGFGALATVGKGLDVLRGWRKPRNYKDATTAQKFEEHGKMLDNDKRRLDSHEAQLGELRRMNQVQCVAMKALLSHEINGNSVDKLRSANDQLDAYLIGIGK